MGIAGLLPVLRPICEKASVADFAHKRVGVDAHVLLHKGAIACASKLCTGQETDVYVRYVIDRVKMLLHYKVVPVLVFDGGSLPMKAGTHLERRTKREEALKKALDHERKGDMKGAYDNFAKAVPVTPEMAREVIRQLRKLNVRYVVAPYEADAQLAWMALNGQLDLVMTEDSDLVVYGAPQILFKTTKDGYGDLYRAKNLPSLDVPPMYNISPDMFMWMCICAGCDFFTGVKNLGVKRAHALVKKSKTLNRLLHTIRKDARYGVERSFMVDFYRASLVFRHQTIFDTRAKTASHLTLFEEAAINMLPTGIITKDLDGNHELDFLGKWHDDTLIAHIARGDINPKTLRAYATPLDAVEKPIGNRNGGPARRYTIGGGAGIRNPNRRALAALAAASQKKKNSTFFTVVPAKSAKSTTATFKPLAGTMKKNAPSTPLDFNPTTLVSKYWTTTSNPKPKARTSTPKRPKEDEHEEEGDTISTSPKGSKRRKLDDDVDDDIEDDDDDGNDEQVGRTRRESPEKIHEIQSTPTRPEKKRQRSLSPMSRAKRRLPSRSSLGQPTKSDMTKFVNRFAKKSSIKPPLKKSATPRREKNDDDGDDDSGDNGNSGGVQEVPVSQWEVRSRYFPTGKRLTLPTQSLTVSARKRPLVKQVARSAPNSSRGVTDSGRQVRGKKVVNKRLGRRWHTAEK